MPDDVGGQPFPDGEEPDSRDHGPADDEFASVVLDEDFVRAAEVHEPTATERILAAAQSHAESELPRIFEEGRGYGRGDADPDGPEDPDADEGRFDRSDYASDFPGYPDHSDYPGYPGYPGFPGYPEPPGYSAYGAGTAGYPPELDPAFEPYEHGSDYGYSAYGPRGRSHGRFGRPYGSHGDSLRPYRGHRAWQRPIAWVLAVVMGIGMVALAFTAVYRGAASQRQEPSPPPATTGVDSSGAPGAPGTPGGRGGVAPGALPSVSADTGAPTASAEPPSG